jgi:hypothetical protein
LNDFKELVPGVEAESRWLVKLSSMHSNHGPLGQVALPRKESLPDWARLLKLAGVNTLFSTIKADSLNLWRAVLGLALLCGMGGCKDPGHQTETNDSRFLIRDGQALSEIVITENPPRVVRFASGELQTYLEKITGVELPIVHQPSGGDIIPIFVGISPHTEKLGLSTEGLRHGAFRKAAGEDWLALLGPDRDFEPVEPWGRGRGADEANRVHGEFKTITGKPFASNMSRLHQRYEEELDIWEEDDLGTSNAVYTFLESLGVRWFAPGELGQVVPQLASIALPKPQNEAVEPDFALRKISFGYKHLGIPELTLWMMRLRANSGGDLIGLTQHCHGMRFVHEREEMKKLRKFMPSGRASPRRIIAVARVRPVWDSRFCSISTSNMPAPCSTTTGSQ